MSTERRERPWLGTTFAKGVRSLELSEPTERVCKNCGQPFLGMYLPTLQTICTACVNQSVRLSEEQARESLAEERRRLLERMGLTGRLSGMTLDAFNGAAQPAAFAATTRFVERFPDLPTLILLGSPGRGKSHLAAGALHALLKSGYEGRYMHVPTATADLRLAENWQQAAAKLFVPLRRADCLVLDDLGREKSSDALAEQLDALLNQRWLDGAPTIVTANLTLAELFGDDRQAGVVGRALASRLADRALIEELRGADWRVQPGRRPAVVASDPDPLSACDTCKGNGWVLDAAVPVGRADRLIKCPACQGRRY